jgi:hypothetical protein
MGKEEQIEEREVLDSIFPEEIQGMFGFHGGLVLETRNSTKEPGC